MAVTLIGGAGPEYPRSEPLVLVERKATWAEGWTLDPELEPVRASDFTGQDIGICILRRRYAPAVADPPPTEFAEREPTSLRGHWVRLRLAGAGDPTAEGGIQTIWTGRIQVEKRSIQGASGGERGVESWIAYGPLDILRKIHIHSSWWWTGSETVEVGFVPSVNFRRAGDIEGGNRSGLWHGGTYVFDFERESTESHYSWSNHMYLYYVLKRFVQQEDGPVWTIGGDIGLIEDLVLRTPLRGGETALQLLDRMVPARYGCGYRIAATEDGFEVRIFSLVAHHAVFYGSALNANPDSILVDASESHDLLGCDVERSNTQLYDTIRVVGERRKVICSIAGVDVQPMWSDALETEYKAGTGTPGDTSTKHDTARSVERLKHVYQAFGAVPTWSPSSPLLDKNGQLVAGTASLQKAIRRTLPYLMLREGWDYTTDPPVTFNPAGVEGDFVPPLVIVKLTNVTDTPWVPIDKLDMLMAGLVMKMKNASVRALDHEWGVLIESDPRHALAENHWAGANSSWFDPGVHGVDYENMAITIAVEQDHHLEVSFDLAEGFRAGDGSVMVLREPGAEFWYLAPDTYVDANGAGELVQSPSTGVELRNDASRLARVAAGAIARYCTARARARITKKRLEAWGEVLGHILAIVEDAEHTEKIYAPVTSVAWKFEGSLETVIGTGFSS